VAELIISTKRVFRCGPSYGEGCSRKSFGAATINPCSGLVLNYVDIFTRIGTIQRTPLEETLGALDQIVRAAKPSMSVENYRQALEEAAGLARTFRLTPLLPSNPVIACLIDVSNRALSFRPHHRHWGHRILSPLPKVCSAKNISMAFRKRRRRQNLDGGAATANTPAVREKIRKLTEIARLRSTLPKWRWLGIGHPEITSGIDRRISRGSNRGKRESARELNLLRKSCATSTIFARPEGR